MLKSQQELNFSQYTDLYDKLIPQNHLFRKINELIDFSFIRDELKDKYCPDNGRTAEDPDSMAAAPQLNWFCQNLILGRLCGMTLYEILSLAINLAILILTALSYLKDRKS